MFRVNQTFPNFVFSGNFHTIRILCNDLEEVSDGHFHIQVVVFVMINDFGGLI